MIRRMVLSDRSVWDSDLQLVQRTKMGIMVVLMVLPTPLCFLLGAKASHPHSVPA